MAFDLNTYPDTAVLTTREVAAWLGRSVKSVLRMGLPPANIKTREAHFLAKSVKDYVGGTMNSASSARRAS